LPMKSWGRKAALNSQAGHGGLKLGRRRGQKLANREERGSGGENGGNNQNVLRDDDQNKAAGAEPFAKKLGRVRKKGGERGTGEKNCGVLIH